MLERLGYFFLIIVLLVYIVLMFKGLIEALPWGIIGFIAIAGFGLLFIKVVKDRISNKEDDYYDKNVKK
jgi:F0F1-type ATP synthase assembly protein I